MTDRIVIGTRGSKLALWQTNWVKSQIERAHQGLTVDLKIISTKGDRVQDVSLPKLGEQGKGLFTKELEEAMLEKEIDLAVHSLKDLPTELPSGLAIGAICEREDVRDALVRRPPDGGFLSLPGSAIIGTSSLRRQAQIRALRPDLRLEPVRGNVDTRLRKLDAGEYDALILASAGLRRLGFGDRITEYLDEELMLPAVGQGALAVEIRDGDPVIEKIVRTLDHEATRVCCEAERALLKGLGGGCLVPIAALARTEDGRVHLKALVASPDGSQMLRGERSGPASDSESVGRRLAEQLLKDGASEILGSGK